MQRLNLEHPISTGSSGITDLNRLGTILYMGSAFRFPIYNNVNSFGSFSWEYAMFNKSDIDYYETASDAESGINMKTGGLKDAQNKYTRELIDATNDEPAHYEARKLQGLTKNWRINNLTIEHSTNKANVQFNPAEIKVLDQIVNTLLANPVINAEITSFASKKGTNQMQLSQARATKMKEKVLELAKVKGASTIEIESLTRRITAIGKGVPESSSNKAADNDDQSDRVSKVKFSVQSN